MSVLANKSAVALVKVIEQFKTLIKEELPEQLEILGTYTHDQLAKLDEELELKKSEMAILSSKFDEAQRTAQVNMDLDLKEHGVSIAKSFAGKHDLVVIPKDEYQSLQDDIQDCKNYRTTFEAETQGKYLKELEQTKLLLEAKSSAEVAKLQSELEAQKQNMAAKDDVIYHLRDTLAKAQQGIVDVASKPTNVHIPKQENRN